MRFAFVAFGLLAALIFAPWVSLDGDARASAVRGVPFERIGVARLGPPARQGDAVLAPIPEVSAVALAFLPRPSLDTMPILPDIAAPLPNAWADDPVDVSWSAPQPLDRTPAAKLAPAAEGPVDGSVDGAVSDAVPVRNAGKFLRPPARDVTPARVVANRLVMRDGPAKRFSRSGVLDFGTRVEITGARSGSYLPIRVASNGPNNGQSGWVFHRYVDPAD